MPQPQKSSEDNKAHQTTREVSHLKAFHVLVVRVIELFVHKSIQNDVSLDRMTELINTNALSGLVRRMIQETTPDINCNAPVTLRDVILSITQFMKSPEIKIHGNGSPDFNVMLNRTQFNELISTVYKQYEEEVLLKIRADEENYKKKLLEISLIEKGELDNVIISEFNQKNITEHANLPLPKAPTTAPALVPPPVQREKPEPSIPLLPVTQQVAPASAPVSVPVPATTALPSSAPLQQRQPSGPPPSSVPKPTISSGPVVDTQETVDAPTSADIEVPIPTAPSMNADNAPSTTEAEAETTTASVVDDTTANDIVMTDAVPLPPVVPEVIDEEMGKNKKDVSLQEETKPSSQQSSTLDKESTVEELPVSIPTQAVVPVAQRESAIVKIIQDDKEGPVTEETTTTKELETKFDEVPAPVVKEEEEEKGKQAEEETHQQVRVDDEDDQTESELSDSKQDEEDLKEKEETEAEDEDRLEDAEQKLQGNTAQSKKRGIEDVEPETSSVSHPMKKRTRLPSGSTTASSAPSSASSLPPNKKLLLIANPLIAQISSYKYASTFLQPVQESNAPEYHSLIKQPRDLKTIKQMVKDGRIQTRHQLERDILLMFANAVMYNKTGSDISIWTKEMQLAVDEMIKMFKDVGDE